MAARRQDMRRPDLVVPYIEPANQKNDNDFSGTVSSTLPMAAIFTRNKFIGWVSVIFSLQGWLAETPESKKNAATPAYFSVAMSFLALGVGYMQLFLPPTPGRTGVLSGLGSGTEPAAATPS